MRLENYKDFMQWHNELEELLNNHDWYYLYSDDNRVYVKGHEERERINELVAKLGKTGEHLFDDAIKRKEQQLKGSWGGAMLWAATKDDITGE
tara:strand:+ start:169 stop:447 length:279 start_codon:yes stop_codon:yes gene_type:complete